MTRYEKGLACPHCGNLENKCIESRVNPGGKSTRRRRQCQKCGARFTTRETVVTDEDELRIESTRLICDQEVQRAFDETLEKVSALGGLLQTWRDFNRQSVAYRRTVVGQAILDELIQQARKEQP